VIARLPAGRFLLRVGLGFTLRLVDRRFGHGDIVFGLGGLVAAHG
jgi:hypothetical protein